MHKPNQKTKPIIYLANALGFSDITKPALSHIKTCLEDIGYSVWEPFERSGSTVDMNQAEWPLTVAKANAKDIMECDLLFAILNGEPPDVGVFWELGFATALKKPQVFFRDDFRKCSDSEQLPANLMMATGFDNLATFSKHCYQNVNELTDPNKFIMEFLRTIGYGVTAHPLN